MDCANDYLTNLEVVERFPWSIYHRPIRAHVLRVIEEEGRKGPLEILSVGCGLSQIIRHIDPRHAFRGVDIDPRAIDICRARYGPRFEVCEPYRLPLGDAQFDIVFSTEVIEHVIDTRRWLQELLRVLKPGGRLQLSTPNYGDGVLPVLEKTFLEWVARRNGFTRKGLHPVPFRRNTLVEALARENLHEIRVEKSFLWLALLASARK